MKLFESDRMAAAYAVVIEGARRARKDRHAPVAQQALPPRRPPSRLAKLSADGVKTRVRLVMERLAQ